MEVFNGLHIGEVKSVDLVSKMGSDSKHYNAVYVHFTTWYDTKVAHDFQKRLLDPTKEVKVMYDHPWYWIVLENKGKKHLSGDRKQKIDLDSFNTPEKPIVSALKITPTKIKNTKSVIKLPKPVNLEAAFEAECANNRFTQDELDWLDEQAEFNKKCANHGFSQEELDWLDDQVECDKPCNTMSYLSLCEHINGFKCEVASLNAQLALTVSERNSFEERYIKETAKNDTLMEILKDVHNKK
jgi:hypothetical protein